MLELIFSTGALLIAILVAIDNVLLKQKLEVVEKHFANLKEKHNRFVSDAVDEINNIAGYLDELCDDVNENFYNIEVTHDNIKETFDDIINTMDLMCDTDEAFIKRINSIEEDIDDLSCGVDNLDDMLLEFILEDAEEEVEAKSVKQIKKENKKANKKK